MPHLLFGTSHLTDESRESSWWWKQHTKQKSKHISDCSLRCTTIADCTHQWYRLLWKQRAFDKLRCLVLKHQVETNWPQSVYLCWTCPSYHLIIFCFCVHTRTCLILLMSTPYVLTIAALIILQRRGASWGMGPWRRAAGEGGEGRIGGGGGGLWCVNK